MAQGVHGLGCYMILVTLHSWVPLKGGLHVQHPPLGSAPRLAGSGGGHCWCITPIVMSWVETGGDGLMSCRSSAVSVEAM